MTHPVLDLLPIVGRATEVGREELVLTTRYIPLLAVGVVVGSTIKLCRHSEVLSSRQPPHGATESDPGSTYPTEWGMAGRGYGRIINSDAQLSPILGRMWHLMRGCHRTRFRTDSICDKPRKFDCTSKELATRLVSGWKSYEETVPAVR